MGVDVTIAAAPNMPPVTTATEGATDTNGQSQIVQSPAAKAAEAGQIAAADATTNAEAAVSPAIAKAGEATAVKQDMISAEATREADERQALLDARKPIIVAAEKQAREAEDRYANFKFYDWWGKQSTGDRISAKLAQGLESFVNVHAGRNDTSVADSINHIIDRDFERQKIDLHSKEQLSIWKRQGVNDLYAHLQNELAALDLKQAKAHEAVAAKAEAMALRAGVPVDVAKQNVITAKQNEAAQDQRVKTAQRYERNINEQHAKNKGSQEITNKPGGGGIDEKKISSLLDVAQGHASYLAKELPTLNDSEKQAITRIVNSETWGEKWPGIKAATSALGLDEQHGATSRVRAYVEHLHRYELNMGFALSGANVAEGEKQSIRGGARPRIDDSPEDLKMRAQNLLEDVSAMRKRFGGTTTTPGGPLAPEVGATRPITSGPHKGGRARWNGTAWHRIQ